MTNPKLLQKKFFIVPVSTSCMKIVFSDIVQVLLCENIQLVDN